MTAELAIDRPNAATSERSSSDPSSSWRRRSSGRATRVLQPARPAAPAAPRAAVQWIVEHPAARQAGSFALIGVASTAAYVAIYAALRAAMPAAAANAVALLVTAVGNTAANRRLTFAKQGREGLARDHAAGLLALGVALAVTSVSLAGLDLVTKHPSRLVELAVLVGANAFATLVRFVLLRFALDRRRALAVERVAR